MMYEERPSSMPLSGSRADVGGRLGHRIDSGSALERIRNVTIIVYPLVNLLLCAYFSGDNMATVSFIFTALITLLALLDKRIGASTAIAVSILLFSSLFALFREENLSSYSMCLLFSSTALYLAAFSPRYFEISGFWSYLNENKNFALRVQTLFLIVLAYYVSLFGLKAGWNTYVLQGPYNYPHTLAYLLLLYSMLDLYYFLNDRSIIGGALFLVCEALIVLTAVRTALLASVSIVLFGAIHSVRAGKIGYRTAMLVVAIGVALVLVNRGLTKSLLAKNQLAIANSSFTNGRASIAVSSLNALGTDGAYEKNLLFGIGMTRLLSVNGDVLSASIHAHNDFVDVLVCYGIVNLVLYCACFYSFGKNSLAWILCSVGVLALGNGLFPYIDCVPMLVFARALFESAELDDVAALALPV